MKFVGRFVVQPWATVQSSWLDWPSQSSGMCAVCITAGSDGGQLEVSLDRRSTEKDSVGEHLRASVGAGTGVWTMAIARVDSTKVRIQLASRAPAPVHGEIRMEDDRME